MSDEGREHDPLLDAGLEEVLGGRRPPNLAPRIAQAWAVRSGQIASGAWTAPADFVLPPPPNGMVPTVPQNTPPQNGRGQYAKPIPLSPLPAQPTNPAAATPAAPMAEFVGLARPIPVAGVPVAQPTPPPRSVETTPAGGVPAIHDRPRTLLPRDQAGWTPWVVAASLLVAAGIATYAVYKSFGPGDKPIVNQPTDPPRDNKLPDRPVFVKQDPPKNQKTPKPNRTPGDSPEVLVQGPRSPGPAIQPIPEPQVVALIDESLAAAWIDHGVNPAELAGDEEWCRRLFLRTLGRVPTVSESRAFVADESKKKRDELTDRLLTGAEYADELARHWSGVWTTALVGRTQASPELREGLRAYLEQAIRTNKPYDALVTELVTATGPAATGPTAIGADAGTKGAVNFLLALADKDERAVRTTSRTTHVLLGAQLECARCHEHPFQKVGPDQYWTLNSFFRQMEVQGAGGQRELAKVDFAGDKPQEGDAGDGGVRYLDPAGKEQVAYPRRLDGTELAKSGRVADVDRRAELAKEIVASPAFGRTLINRLWTQYFGIGFIRPTEQLSPRGEASHPELLARLGEQFAAHGHDLRKAMRWIVASRAFSLSTKAGEIGSSRDQPLAGTVALFSHYYVLPSTSERIDKSLLNLADAARTGRNMADEKGQMAWLHARSGPDLPRRPEALSIEAPSGAPIGQAVDLSEGGLLDRLATSKLSHSDKITHLFLAAFGREPTQRERDAAKDLFAARKDDTIGALQDLWWALLHSNEFNGL